jgi:hypothetical protein
MKRVTYFRTILFVFLCFALTSCSSALNPTNILPTAALLPTSTLSPNATSEPVTIKGVSNKPFSEMLRPIPPHDILFSQNFEDGSIGDWENRSSTPLTILSEDGNHYLHFVASGDISWPGIWKTEVDHSLWHDYAFESKVRFYDSGLVFAFYENNWSFYQGGLAFPDAIYFSDYVADRSESYQQFKVGGYSFVPGQWYTVRIEVQGDQLSMYIDDQLWLQAERDTISSGGIGFVSGSEHSGTFDIDDIRVRQLD